VSDRDRRRGIVLVTVLWSIALLSALAMAASVSFRSFAGMAAIGRDRVQGEALLTAGLEVSAAIIDAATNAGGRPLNDVETSVTLSTGTARARISDEGGRIDIGRAPVEVLASLLRAVGAPAGQADYVAQAIVAWRNTGSTNTGSANSIGIANSAVSRTGQLGNNATTNSPNLNPNNSGHPFADILDLAQIPGVAPGWINAMRPLTTIYGSDTVNPLTAPAGVIAALPGVDDKLAQAFLAARRQTPTDAARISAILGPAQRYLAEKKQAVAAVSLTATLPDGYATAARAVVVVMHQDYQPYRVLVWKPLPPSALL
jgi:general secretion pathway protein K